MGLYSIIPYKPPVQGENVQDDVESTALVSVCGNLS